MTFFLSLIFSYIKATAISPGYMVVGTATKRNSMKKDIHISTLRIISTMYCYPLLFLG